ncbi:MAG: YkgJ family cysteine cluster protein [Bryobacterales bacterium]|nr:YkgJ family cysteine cluster protein [Bryobacterales bacterium]
MIDRYLKICTAFEVEFERNRKLHGSRIQCRAGCSDCCHQLFQITEVEAAWISHGVAMLPDSRREELRTRAAVYLEERRKLVTAKGEPEAWGSLPPVGTRLACPALENGVCTIYEYRPLICRKFGIPLYNPDKPGRVFACELNFKAGDAIEDGQLVRIQTSIHQDWKRLQAAYNDAGLARDPEPITVARALMEDFSKLVPTT